MIQTEKACCFTGHRDIPAETRPTLVRNLERHLRQLALDGIEDFITGGARGFDALAAQAVLALKQEMPGLRLVLALPCKDQTRGWSRADTKLYQEILEKADLAYWLAEQYDTGCMMRRNRFMVDHSCCCAFYLVRPRSGTYQTVRYAMEQGRRLCNLLY